MKRTVKFKVCCLEPTEPFIFYIFGGYITRHLFEELEDELLLQLEEEIQQASNKGNDLVIEATHVESETQYGSGEGNVHTIPAYWSLTKVGTESNEMGIQVGKEDYQE